MFREIIETLKNIFKWWVTVSPWEQAVRVRLGKNVSLLNEGVHVRVPVIDRIYLQTTRERYCNITTQTLTTTDGKIVTVSGNLGYEIVDVLRLYETVHHPEEVMMGIIQRYITEYVINRTAKECNSRGLCEYINERVDFENYGLSYTAFVLTDFVITPRTYRLIQGEPRNWLDTDRLRTDTEIGSYLL